MTPPVSTYRIQFNKDFKFSQLLPLLDYLKALGISTIYSSPIFKATPGSMHGYDVTDPNTVNPEIGTEDEFFQLVERVGQLGMTWLQDIVPNHMAFHSDNFRLMDVLERGPQSEFYNYFDIDWDHPDTDLKGKVMVPFLGKPLVEAVDSNEIKIDFKNSGFVVTYYSSAYPLSVSVLPSVLSGNSHLQEDVDRLITVSGKRHVEWQEEKNKFSELVLADTLKSRQLIECLERVNRDKTFLKKFLDRQYYTLCYWKDSESRMNYRRFFTVNELICLRMEDPGVFQDYHYLVGEQGPRFLNGARVDHIDGLNQPARYLHQLRSLLGRECFIIAEKILEAHEDISADWPIEGTSGYEFLAQLNRLVTNKKGADKLRTFYKQLVPGQPPYSQMVLANKMLILKKYMGGEWDNLTRLFLATSSDKTLSFERARSALGAFMVSLPVYRIYPEALPVKGRDLHVVNDAVNRAKTNFPKDERGIDSIAALFTTASVDDPCSALSFIQTLMQFTGPLTAKGVEDTTFYNYNALLSHDEVGDSPSTLATSVNQFHQQMVHRQLSTPLSLNTTATHDTKRGEDARMRLNALCDLADEWTTAVNGWIEHNRRFRQRTSQGVLAPMINDEYFIYQSILAGIPSNLRVDTGYRERFENYLRKVLREAKVHSDWSNPDLEYEESCISFFRAITSSGTPFMTSLDDLMAKVRSIANRYSVVQAFLKVVLPGIPDTYQGCELFDLSYVDPDNRRPVDYSLRQKNLERLIQISSKDFSEVSAFLNEGEEEGMTKMFVLWKALNFRMGNAPLFSTGEYLPLQVAGKETTMLAFARVLRDQWIIAVVPLKFDIKAMEDLSDEIVLPDSAPSAWKNILTGESIRTNSRLAISSVSKQFALALLVSAQQ